jgi:hypothetical protein
MRAGIEDFERQAGHVSGDGDRSPCLTGHGSPRTVADQPRAIDAGLEGQATAPQGVGGWNWGPPRGGLAEVSGGDGDHIGPDTQQRGEVDHVVVSLARIGPHRSSGDLDPIDGQSVATVRPDPRWRRIRRTGELDGGAGQDHDVLRIVEDRSGRCGGADRRASVPYPATTPPWSERGGMVEAHGKNLP